MIVIRTTRRMLAVWLILTAAVLPARAQITTGTVTGGVVDAQGAVVPGAAVAVISETQGTTSAAAITTAAGVYVAPALKADLYTVEVTMTGFKTASRTHVRVSGGDRVVVETLVLEVGAASETITVHAASTVAQAASGERSAVVEMAQLESLPFASHDFQQFLAVIPGVNGVNRIGGGGQDNYMIDGVSAMDTGNNGLMGGLNLPVDAIAEVKVLTSGYPAEYGRSSGLQVSAVTRSGTNQFKWSLFSYERNSPAPSTTWANVLNGYPQPVSQGFDAGYTLGGPAGKPGGKNRLFFFYAHEYRPRRAGRIVNVVRLPTALERRGDFSQTRDANGLIYNSIYDASTGLPKTACSATDTRACFQDRGVVGRIPLDRLYGPGIALLNQYPVPNLDSTAALGFNYAVVTPIQTTLAHTPVIRLDYQASTRLRLTGKVAAQTALIEPAIGTLPGFDDTLQKFPLSLNASATAAYTIGATTFLEATIGANQNRLGAPPISSFTNRNSVVCPGDLAAAVPRCMLGGIAQLFPDAGVMDPRYYEYGALQEVGAPFFQDGRSLLPPQLAWAAAGTASRIRTSNCSAGSCAPPSLNFPGFMNINRTRDVVLSVTRLIGSHTAKAGFYWNHSYKAQNLNSSLNFQGRLNFGNDSTNPVDTGFPFANAAVGVFSSYAQQSSFIEGSFLYDNAEWYLQDNWKATNRLTLDYGVRFVHQTPQYDEFNQAANFFPERWVAGNAPRLYVPACAGASPCTGADRQAMDPGTGALLGPDTATLVGQAILGTGDLANGMAQAGHGIAETGYRWPWLGVAPRIGAAYDVTGRKTLIVRGAVGLFFDRPDGNTVFNTVANPPVATGLTQQWGRLTDLAQSPLAFGPVPTVRVYYYDSKLPADVQWNAGFQLALPAASSLDVSYVGHHAYDVLGGQQAGNPVDLNTIDLGTTLTSAGQDPTQPAGMALPANLLRPYRGYSNIQVQWGRFHRTFHSLQASFTRRVSKGLSAGVNWTYSISDTGNTGLPSPQLRLDHRPDGSYAVRADQAEAEALFADQGVLRHLVVSHFTWRLPDMKASSRTRRLAGLIVNRWQVAGVLRIDSGAPYDVTYGYQSGGGIDLTGSPDYTARVVIKGDPGSGCSGNQYQQFNTAAFSGPLPGSAGLESGRNLMHGCGDHRFDLSLQRGIPIGHGRELQIRMDVFNVFNAVIFNARNVTAEYASPSDQRLLNAQYLLDGRVDPARLLPNNAGFGAATSALPTRSIRWQVKMKF